MKKIIIGIHGLGNKPPRDLLKRWWLKSIHEGLRNIQKDHLRIPFEMVYWSDVLYGEPLNPALTDKKHPLYLHEYYKKSPGRQRDDFSKFRVKVLKYIENRLDKIFLNEDLSINFSAVTDTMIRHYFEDLAKYYDNDCQSPLNPDCPARQIIRQRLAGVMKKYRNYDILLIAHSMGSIIAYDVLTEIKNVQAGTLVTIGSPLGIPVIVNKIHKEQSLQPDYVPGPGVPESIKNRWLNMSDVRDKVALDHTLVDDFKDSRSGIMVEDITVYNDYETGGESNPHKSYGYLRTPELAAVIDEFLTKGHENPVMWVFQLLYARFVSLIRNAGKLLHIR